MLALSTGAPVRCVGAGGPPLYGRLCRTPQGCAPSLVYVRLMADHPRAPKGSKLYVLAKSVRPYRRGLHASGVRTWGPDWLRPWRKRR